ncbi:hypothetical protein BMG00_00165 [Thioclava marina]|uniref:Alkaline proteinase inhibitor/ Outer membrane lipoprotein Omp19 domain-containing protein n=1 Tax=Thioclava marina TaxID=1915077 RepID=A0ABX3MLM2_9RHOB|nr:hypothetical protein [Thioclava marina]MBD3739038.1 hypothetical protein [Stutzerimonas balearica]OOY12322.1 hypothetical protein BMG00_00165 [Thioclava marina]
MKPWFALILIASPAMAEMPDALELDPTQVAPATLACHFTTECYEAEPCQGTAYDAELQVIPQKSAFTPNTKLTSDAGSVWMSFYPQGSGSWLAEPARFLGFDASATHLITRGPDGAARYTVQMTEGPMVISYLGSCEEAK